MKANPVAAAVTVVEPGVGPANTTFAVPVVGVRPATVPATFVHVNVQLFAEDVALAVIVQDAWPGAEKV